MGSIPPKNHDTMTPTNYHEGYHEIPRIPGKPGEQLRSRKCDFCLSLLVKLNVGERGRMPCWCPWPESNQHSLRNSILSRARLPVPPQGHSVGPGKGRREAGGL